MPCPTTSRNLWHITCSTLLAQTASRLNTVDPSSNSAYNLLVTNKARFFVEAEVKSTYVFKFLTAGRNCKINLRLSESKSFTCYVTRDETRKVIDQVLANANSFDVVYSGNKKTRKVYFFLRFDKECRTNIYLSMNVWKDHPKVNYERAEASEADYYDSETMIKELQIMDIYGDFNKRIQKLVRKTLKQEGNRALGQSKVIQNKRIASGYRENREMVRIQSAKSGLSRVQSAQSIRTIKLEEKKERILEVIAKEDDHRRRKEMKRIADYRNSIFREWIRLLVVCAYPRSSSQCWQG